MKSILSDLGLVTVGDEQAWAVISPDDRYRYILARMWDDYFTEWQGQSVWRPASATRPLWVYGMLNPSKARGRGADGKPQNDPTIRKCEGFARRGGAGGFLVVNLMAFSATKPEEMVRAHESGVDVRGEHNAAAIHWAVTWASPFRRNIAAWGIVPKKLCALAQEGVNQFRSSRPECFGINADGSPKHPLMLAYDTLMVRL